MAANSTLCKHLLLLVVSTWQMISYMQPVYANPWPVPQRRESPPVMHEQEVLEIRKALDSASIEKWYSVSFVSLSEGVLLQGLVDSSETSGTLERIVREVTGRQVINELKIRPRWQDHVVQQRLVETLELSHPDVHTRLDVQVADGVAHIWGDLPNRRKVDAILATTLMVEGVRDIKSHISVGGNPYVGYAMARWKE